MNERERGISITVHTCRQAGNHGICQQYARGHVTLSFSGLRPRKSSLVFIQHPFIREDILYLASGSSLVLF